MDVVEAGGASRDRSFHVTEATDAQVGDRLRQVVCGECEERK